MDNTLANIICLFEKSVSTPPFKIVRSIWLVMMRGFPSSVTQCRDKCRCLRIGRECSCHRRSGLRTLLSSDDIIPGMLANEEIALSA